MEKYLHILTRCELFTGIDPGDIPGMLDCLGAVLRSVGKNGYIMSEGDSAEYVGILLSGSARIEKQDFYGNRSIVTDIIPGELFAESFACAGVNTMPVSVVANAEAEYMLIHCQRITVGCSNACCFHSRLIYNLLGVVARRNLEMHRKQEIVSQKTTREKLMTYLLAQAKTAGSKDFTIPFDRQALADYLGVERSAMSTELGKLKKDGVIDFQRSHFTLL